MASLMENLISVLQDEGVAYEALLELSMKKREKKWTIIWQRLAKFEVKTWHKTIKFSLKVPIQIVKINFQSMEGGKKYAYRCICTGTAIVWKQEDS